MQMILRLALSISMILAIQGISFNQPKFCLSAKWNENGTTFYTLGNITNVGFGLFIDTNNYIYWTIPGADLILIFEENNPIPIRNMNRVVLAPRGIFITSDGDMYIDHGYYNKSVEIWKRNGTSGSSVFFVNSSCHSLFMDSFRQLYCSMDSIHVVLKFPANNSVNSTAIIAGNGAAGSTPWQLFSPNGLYVDQELNLYVADCFNHRIQLFRPGQINGTTVVGSMVNGTINLNCPTGLVFDADGNMFILDLGNNRVVRSSPIGFWCVIGCTNVGGSAAHQLSQPRSLAFDNYGNLFVNDASNYRIQRFSFVTESCEPPYNRPKFCANATWNPNGTTIANNATVGFEPYSLFIDTKNTLYVPARSLDRVTMIGVGNSSGTSVINGTFGSPNSVFVAKNGDVYIDNGLTYRRVDLWRPNRTSSISTMRINHICFSLFVDSNDDLYCSTDFGHRVVKRILKDTTGDATTVAGNGTAGRLPWMLNQPRGIFVDRNLSLYVADCINDRVQFFPFGIRNGTTLLNSSTNGLNCPTGVILDADGYLYIVDGDNHRVLAGHSHGYRCILGCTGGPGIAPNLLNGPRTLGFDTYGNAYVVDRKNHRIQKFLFIPASCEEQITTASSIVSATVQTTSIASKSAASETSTSMISTGSRILSTSTYLNQNCSAPIITLIPGTSSMNAPIRFRRSQDFHISSYIDLNCQQSLAFQKQWTIINCTSLCSNSMIVDPNIATGFTELYIPSRTLPFGIYQLKLTVHMNAIPHLSASASAYVELTPSGITANLVMYGTSMITRGYDQDLFLDPGSYSVDLDGTSLNRSDWKYEYYCRIYGLYNFPNINGSLLPIDDTRIDPRNPSCLSNSSGTNQLLWQYGGSGNSPKSSITIQSKSLLSNRTYQFMVYMENHRNASLQATGYLLVQIDDTRPQLIVVACVISTLCSPNLEFQLVNPTTQVALFSVCTGECSSIVSIIWNVYQGVKNSSSNTMHWSLFNQMSVYENRWFFGRHTTNFTSTNDLFLQYPSTQFWRFEVTYFFPAETSSSALNFEINQSPQNGSCSIHPLNGTTNTLFSIRCPNWFDADGIQDYQLYGYRSDELDQTMVAFSSLPDFDVRLPPGDNLTTSLRLWVIIRDHLGCTVQFNLSTVNVHPDRAVIDDLIDRIQIPQRNLNNHPLIRLLAGGNQNMVGQILHSLSLELNRITEDNLIEAVSNGILSNSITVSPLLTGIFTSLNVSQRSTLMNLTTYKQKLNRAAVAREFFIDFTNDLLISTVNSIILQSSTLVQLSRSITELSRRSIELISKKCHQLSRSLSSMAHRIAFEDTKMAVKHLSHCISNTHNAIHGSLQKRMIVLDMDHNRANQFPVDYETDLESEWANPNLFADGDDFSWHSIEKNRNLHYQQQLAEQVNHRMIETINLLTSALKIHVNIGQHSMINTSSSLVFAYETISSENFVNKAKRSIGNAEVFLPLNMSNHSTISIRTMMHRLASADLSRTKDSYTNLSTSISVSILDHRGDEISIKTEISKPLEFLIPRDSNLFIPPVIMQNVTSITAEIHSHFFQFHYVNLSQSNRLPVSFHLELYPMWRNLSYFLIFRFDSAPQFNQSIQLIDGWASLCWRKNLSVDSIYRFYLDHQRINDHRSLIIGIRQLNTTEDHQYCQSNDSSKILPKFDRPFHFTSDYGLRNFLSGCYYLDGKNQWQSDGLIVGPLTNITHTHCLSDHL